jgi:murein DD-endopeptidase MepM/ murein hydrolase activator NlpD
MRACARVRAGRVVVGAALLLLVPSGVEARSTGGIEFFDHVFPVQGPHWRRGYIGEFSAPRSGGRVHEGFDVVAACRTPLVAAATGRVLRIGTTRSSTATTS